MSTAFHAHCAGAPEAADFMARLTTEERAKVSEWLKPADTSFTYGGVEFILRYAEAATEQPVALTARGGACHREDPKAITAGTLDMAWTVTLPDGRKVAYVADIKKTQWTATDGPDSLQVAAYAFAWAARHSCDAYCCGIWQATEGQWHWGEVIPFDSPEASETWEAIKASAMNVGGEFSTGPHCSGCWSRFQCPAHLLPPEVAETSLAPLAGQAITQDNALRLLQLVERAEDTAEVARKALKVFAAQNGGITDPATGKVWKPVLCEGRQGFDKAKALADFPQLEGYVKKGAPYDTFRWTGKAKK